jgi:Ca2+/Na+ antiporter
MWLRYENRELAQFGGKNGAAPRMLRRSISVMLAAVLIVAAVAIFVLMPGKVVVVAVAAFCLIAGVIWLYGELSDLRRGQ